MSIRLAPPTQIGALVGVRYSDMVDIRVRVLDEDEWQLYRALRLAALEDAPGAFVNRFEDEASYDESFWRERMSHAHRFVAESEGGPVGLVGLGLHNEDPEIGEVVGLWTAPAARGQNVALSLVSLAHSTACENGLRLLYYWVGSDNAAAIGFASRFGFHPTEERRPVQGAKGVTEQKADEVAMRLSLSSDPTHPTDPYLS